MTSHVHFDVDAIAARMTAEIERTTHTALSSTTDPENRSFITCQQRLLLAFIAVHREFALLANEGVERRIAEAAFASVLAGNCAGKIEEFGDWWASHFFGAMEKAVTGKGISPGKVVAHPVQGGTA